MKSVRRKLDDFEVELIRKKESELSLSIVSKLNWRSIIILVFLTILSAILIYFYDQSNWSLIAKFTVCLFPIIIWVLIERHLREKKKISMAHSALNRIKEDDGINVLVIRVERIAQLPEYEDEGDLYLIETDSSGCIYLWDYESEINNNGLRRIIEIYLNKEVEMGLGKRIRCSGESLEPVLIDSKKKWKYLKENGFPEDFELEPKSFEEKVKEIQSL